MDIIATSSTGTTGHLYSKEEEGGGGGERGRGRRGRRGREENAPPLNKTEQSKTQRNRLPLPHSIHKIKSK